MRVFGRLMLVVSVLAIASPAAAERDDLLTWDRLRGNPSAWQAWRHTTQGDVDAAERALLDWLVDEEPQGWELLLAAFLAQETDSRNALQEARRPRSGPGHGRRLGSNGHRWIRRPGSRPALHGDAVEHVGDPLAARGGPEQRRHVAGRGGRPRRGSGTPPEPRGRRRTSARSHAIRAQSARRRDLHTREGPGRQPVRGSGLLDLATPRRGLPRPAAPRSGGGGPGRVRRPRDRDRTQGLDARSRAADLRLQRQRRAADPSGPPARVAHPPRVGQPSTRSHRRRRPRVRGPLRRTGHGGTQRGDPGAGEPLRQRRGRPRRHPPGHRPARRQERQAGVAPARLTPRREGTDPRARGSRRVHRAGRPRSGRSHPARRRPRAGGAGRRGGRRLHPRAHPRRDGPLGRHRVRAPCPGPGQGRAGEGHRAVRATARAPAERPVRAQQPGVHPPRAGLAAHDHGSPQRSPAAQARRATGGAPLARAQRLGLRQGRRVDCRGGRREPGSDGGLEPRGHRQRLRADAALLRGRAGRAAGRGPVPPGLADDRGRGSRTPTARTSSGCTPTCSRGGSSRGTGSRCRRRTRSRRRRPDPTAASNWCPTRRSRRPPPRTQSASGNGFCKNWAPHPQGTNPVPTGALPTGTTGNVATPAIRRSHPPCAP